MTAMTHTAPQPSPRAMEIAQGVLEDFFTRYGEISSSNKDKSADIALALEAYGDERLAEYKRSQEGSHGSNP